jgi:hypothetical protein
MKDLIETPFINYINIKTDNDSNNHIEEIEHKLKETLNEEEKKLLLEYANLHFDFLYQQSIEKFKQGFWIGFEMMRELQEM